VVVIVADLDESLRCPACGAPALADDEFCEACGTSIGRRRAASREHVEIDVGVAAGVSDRGMRHERNEDALFVAATGDWAVAVVCDGVSQSAAPLVASQIAAQAAGERLRDLVQRADDGNVAVSAEAMADTLTSSGEAVADVPWMEVADRVGPSCTVVAAVWDGSMVTLGWAGDSRAYWIDPVGVRLLTTDHSWAQEQVASGAMTAAAAEVDPRAHAITRWLGGDAPEPADTTTWRPGGPGVLVLCSDGLWNVLDGPEELARLLESSDDRTTLALARRLASTALGRGGHDNVTVAVIEIEPRED
jgi:serine/threonine protein phosphatase PrpC